MKKLLVTLFVAGSLAACQSSANPAHGEKGHKCDKECMAKQMPVGSDTTNITPATSMKDHVCTAACKDGNHAYAHGEKGHTCDSNCPKM